MDVSFGTIWEGVARRLPDAVAISEPEREFTYAEFDERAARLAAALERVGVGPGDRVACYLYNGAAYLETVFAAMKLGAVPVNANYRYTRGELSRLLADAGAAALVFSGELAANVGHAARHVPTLRLLVRAGGGAGADGPHAPELEELLAATEPRPARPRPGSDQLVMYTGGTTGRPKGVLWRQADLLHSLVVPIFRPVGVAELPGTLDEAVEIAVATRTGGRAPVTMPVVPLMHATGLFNSMGALLVGGRVVTERPGGLDPRRVWRTVARHRVATLIVAGDAVCRPLVDELLAAERAGDPHELGSLRVVISSGASLRDQLKRAVHERTDVTIFDAIAASEGGPFAFAVTSSAADLPARFFPVPGASVRAEVVPGSGQVGMLAYQGPMPLGYLHDELLGARTYRTFGGVRYAMPGDLATVEEDGAINFLGRGSGVINTGGEKVHPHEVEQALLAEPGVTDAVVVGVPDETWGQRVEAIVATVATVATAATAGGGLTEDELRNRARRRLAGYKVPRRIVLLPTLQRSPTGKLEIEWARRILEGASAQVRDHREVNP